jgi:type IV pilus assembly protein PilE
MSGQRPVTQRAVGSDNRDMRHASHSRARSAGFTLTELVIVVAVVGLLATVAMPTFQDTLRKSRRSDAMAALTQLQQTQERFRSQQPLYASSVASMPGSPSSVSPQKHYTLTVDDASAVGYTMTATASASSPQYGDIKCRALRVVMNRGAITHSSVDSTGAVDNTNANRCWPQ